MGAPVLDTASSKISTSPRRGAHFFEDVRFVEAKCVFLNSFCLIFLFRFLEVWVSQKKQTNGMLVVSNSMSNAPTSLCAMHAEISGRSHTAGDYVVQTLFNVFHTFPLGPRHWQRCQLFPGKYVQHPSSRPRKDSANFV